MEKFLEGLEKAEKTIQEADHIIYVTFPLIKDKRLLLKVLQEIKNAVLMCINSILQYEYLYKRIRIYKDARENFRTFKERCAPRYKISSEEITLLIELLDFAESHKASPFEFMKDEKIVILSNNMQPKTLTLEKTKEFLFATKSIIKKTGQILRQNYDF